MFGENALFNEAKFGDAANFVQARFGANANFELAKFGDMTTFDVATFEWDVDFRGEEFGPISFSGAIFTGDSNFAGRNFRGATDFGILSTTHQIKLPSYIEGRVKKDALRNIVWNVSAIAQGVKTQFGVPPKFHGCKIHQDTSFDGAQFPTPSGNSEAGRAYRVLKLAFSQQQAIREEQFFFKYELAEEAKAAETSRDPRVWPTRFQVLRNWLNRQHWRCLANPVWPKVFPIWAFGRSLRCSHKNQSRCSPCSSSAWPCATCSK